ncbi:hypothetical protein PHMEG_00022888 [Phytophthora megakarya]|uniref:PiggyBac transposable element-derived protein domain-containing protein n=1 Tax=Phytophthora megakarya TaxID=4795 RepID=A0A225VKN4_9STRA|nr:hypothetical protein PHMEG_00022888 [Phytophthora megakarya]
MARAEESRMAVKKANGALDVFIGEEELRQYLDKIDIDENQVAVGDELVLVEERPHLDTESKEDTNEEEDVNQVADDEDRSLFAGFESDAENDDGCDDEPSVETLETTEMMLPTPPEMHFDEKLISSVGGIESIASGCTTHTPYDYLQEPFEPRSPEAVWEDYPRLYKGGSGPIARTMASSTTPSGVFFFFMQSALWEDITEESNDYFEASIDERVEGQRFKQVSRAQKHPEFSVKSHDQIRAELQKVAPITARELCVFIGLLLARSIVPNKEKLAHHWRTTDEGAIPRSCFGRFMARDRFMHVSRNLHFSSNRDSRAATDRAWKLRPVIDALQHRFATGFIPPAIMAFDEAMLPSRSTFNRMRVYLKDKLHKWGTKLFMLCCSTTAYCIRGVPGVSPDTPAFSALKFCYHVWFILIFEVYCGKKERAGQASSTDNKAGPIAVVFGSTAPPNGEMRLVVMDRFYSSVPLSMQLLTMGFYSVGTVRTDRQGLSTMLIPKRKKGEQKKPPKIPKNRPANIGRGTFVVSEALHIPGLRVMRWWDTRAVHMLSTGGSIQPDRIVLRNTLTGEQQEVACPRIVKDCQHGRSLRPRPVTATTLCIKYKKYYKGLFLELVDLAIINSYIVYNAVRAAANLPKMSHVKYVKQLHLELCRLRDEDREALCCNESLQATPSKETDTANGDELRIIPY